jgi:dolichyl-phosphate-mannose-protein mannosyltransferase
LTIAASPVVQPKSISVSPTQRTRSWIAVMVLFLVVYAGAMFSPPLLDDADSTHAEAAREMYARGDYVTLHVNGVRYLEKAPMLYWLDAAGYHLFGPNEFATRLPDTLAILGLALLAWRWGRRAFGDRTAIYGALFVVTAAGFFLFTRIQIPEAILSLFVGCSLYQFLSALDDGKRWRWYAGYSFVALAVLTKGLVALVIVGMTALVYVLVSGDWRRWREFRLGTGLLLLFAVAAPWHILAGVRNPGFFWFYFINEHVLRFLGRRFPKDYNKLPAALYWTLHLVWLFPWSAYFPLVARDARHDLTNGIGETGFTRRSRLLFWVWAGVVLVFFAFSTNQEYYTFPAYLPLLLLLAAAIAREEQQRPERKWLIATTAATAAIAMTAGIVLLSGLWVSRNHPFVPDIGSVLSHDLAEDTLSMSHILDLSGTSFAALRLPAALAAIALIVFPLLSLGLRVKKKNFAATWAIAAGMSLFLFAAHVALVRFGPYLSSRSLATAIAERAEKGDKVMIYGDQAFGSSLLFYLRRPIELVNGRTTSMWFGSTYPDAPKIFLTDGDLLQAWNSSQRVFLFVPPHLLKKVDELLTSSKYLIAESSGKVIYSNHP